MAKIIFGSILIAIACGVLHDLVTAHFYVQYFTVHHPHLVDSDSPVVMALLWGVLATWWMGLIAGFLCGFFNGIGSWPSLKPIAVLRLEMRAAAAVLAAAMIVLASTYPTLKVISPDGEARFAATLVTHNFSYIASAGAMAWDCGKVLALRKAEPSPPTTN